MIIHKYDIKGHKNIPNKHSYKMTQTYLTVFGFAATCQEFAHRIAGDGAPACLCLITAVNELKECIPKQRRLATVFNTGKEDVWRHENTLKYKDMGGVSLFNVKKLVTACKKHKQ